MNDIQIVVQHVNQFALPMSQNHVSPCVLLMSVNVNPDFLDIKRKVVFGKKNVKSLGQESDY